MGQTKFHALRLPILVHLVGLFTRCSQSPSAFDCGRSPPHLSHRDQIGMWRKWKTVAPIPSLTKFRPNVDFNCAVLVQLATVDKCHSSSAATAVVSKIRPFAIIGWLGC